MEWGKIIFSRLTIGSLTMFGMPANKRLLLGTMFLSSSTLPHVENAWKLRETPLLIKEEVDHFQVHTNDPVVFLIFE